MSSSSSSSLNILIVGATGKQGGQAASAILAAKASTNPEIHLRFISRNLESESARSLTERGAVGIQADLTDKQSLITALNGVDRAFFMTDALAGEEKEIQQGFTFVDAAKEAGVKVLVYTSVASADEATEVPHFRSKYKVGTTSGNGRDGRSRW